MTVKLPLAAPLALGEKTTVNEVLWPEFSVTGSVSPPKLNPVPLAVTAETVRLDPPLLVKVSDKLELLPSCTLPKPTLVGFAVSAPRVTPVPESGMLKVGFEPLDVMAMLPLAAPLPVGANITVNDALWPALNVKGKAKPLRVKPLPVRVARETVRLDAPELVRVADCVWLLPTWTFAKPMLLGLATS